MDDCLATEMAAKPQHTSTRKVSTAKSKLKSALQVAISARHVQQSDTLVYDVSAMLWTIAWPNEGSHIQVYIMAFKVFTIVALGT